MGAALGDFSTLSISADGHNIVAGAYQEKIGSNTNQGAAYVFVEPPGGWVTSFDTAELTASDGAAGDSFDEATGVSADGSTIVVSAGNATVGNTPNVGAAYVFVRPTNGWTTTTQSAKLLSSDGANGDLFGTGVAIGGDGTVIAVSAYNATVGSNKTQGAAYVFTRPTGGWIATTETGKLTASDGMSQDEFGTSVALNGNGSVLWARTTQPLVPMYKQARLTSSYSR